MTPADWIALVPSAVIGGGVIFRAGQLTTALKDLSERVARIERHIWPPVPGYQDSRRPRSRH
jgi:hypothetical protein